MSPTGPIDSEPKASLPVIEPVGRCPGWWRLWGRRLALLELRHQSAATLVKIEELDTHAGRLFARYARRARVNDATGTGEQSRVVRCEKLDKHEVANRWWKIAPYEHPSASEVVAVLVYQLCSVGHLDVDRVGKLAGRIVGHVYSGT